MVDDEMVVPEWLFRIVSQHREEYENQVSMRPLSLISHIHNHVVNVSKMVLCFEVV